MALVVQPCPNCPTFQRQPVDQTTGHRSQQAEITRSKEQYPLWHGYCITQGVDQGRADQNGVRSDGNSVRRVPKELRGRERLLR